MLGEYSHIYPKHPGTFLDGRSPVYALTLKNKLGFFERLQFRELGQGRSCGLDNVGPKFIHHTVGDVVRILWTPLPRKIVNEHEGKNHESGFHFPDEFFRCSNVQ